MYSFICFISKKISQIKEKSTITSSEILEGYTLGLKNVYPEDDVPVYELRKFPISAYISDIDLNTTKILVEQMRNVSVEVAEQKDILKSTVDKVQTVTSTDVEKANLQKQGGIITYDEATSQLTSTFATPEEFQASVNNVYKALFSAVEEMMVQVFTTSMYARQYTPIYDDVSASYNEYMKYQH